ncbi:hypothetical protein L195_g000545, partial [Trifolium pratense]
MVGPVVKAWDLGIYSVKVSSMNPPGAISNVGLAHPEQNSGIKWAPHKWT